MRLSKNQWLAFFYFKSSRYIAYRIRFRSLKMHPDYDFSVKLGQADLKDDHIAVFRIARIGSDDALYYKAVLQGNYIRLLQGSEVVKDLSFYCTMKDVFKTVFDNFIKTKYE